MQHREPKGLSKRRSSESDSRKSSEVWIPVKETHKMKRDVDELGNKMINQYVFLKELGRGVHGKVKLCKDINDEKYWAVKMLDKNPRRRFQSKLSQAAKQSEGAKNTQLEKIKREIAILKNCSHPHIVRLKEVIDDPGYDKIYLVLEYLPGGEVQWQDDHDPPGPAQSEESARRIFRDLVAGVQYLHYQGIVHRDIKPANLLWTADHRVKISDFGVSVFVGKIKKGKNDIPIANEFELGKTAGSPAFFAPELCNIDIVDGMKSPSNSSLDSSINESSEAKDKLPKQLRMMLPLNKSTPPLGAPIDIWAMGVTLYCLLFGRVPFAAQSEIELFHVINKQPLVYPRNITVSAKVQDLLSRTLEKDPEKRITMEQLRFHEWTTLDMTQEERMTWLDETDPSHEYATRVQVSDDDVSKALTIQVFKTNEKDKIKFGIRKISHSFQNLASNFSKSLSPPMQSDGKKSTSMPVVMGYLPYSLEKKANKLATTGPPSPLDNIVGGADWVRWEPDREWSDSLNEQGSLGLFPTKLLHDRAVPDEKALLIGQVTRYYNYGDSFKLVLPEEIWTVDNEQRALGLQEQFELLGLDTTLQSFRLNREGEIIKGKNVHGILRAPRGEGTEAIVLSAPQYTYNGEINRNGIQLLFSFALFCKKFSFWSKDILFLITDQEYIGTLSWLEAYHGFTSSNNLEFDGLTNHAGAIVSVLNLEFEGTGGYSSVALHPIGVNGRLSNADLITTAAYSFDYAGIPVVLHEKGTHPDHQLGDYGYYNSALKNLWSFIKVQAFGFPTRNHVLFPRYNIEAITLSGIKGRENNVDVTKIGLGIETACRSLNNLLEKFHHAYWFYFMPSAFQFIPISKYVAPLAILIATLVAQSAQIWIASGEQQVTAPKDYVRKPWKYIQREYGSSSFSNKIRPIYMPVLTLALFMFAAIFVGQQTMTWFMIPLLQRLICADAGASRSTTAPVWLILKSFILGLMGLFLFSIATMNPSLSLLMSIPIVPVFLLIRPTANILYYVQMMVLVALSPPVLLFLYAFVQQDHLVAAQLLTNSYFYWDLFGGLLLPWIALAYWPLNLGAQVMISMEL
ncbi:hypothetical protein HK103_003363 [Boothiomyces macroporosus]|uniref:Protein kinase domain-containing protein n=1 Tax=Boothiomyces macroporosus TaxID=261099 RepID=A0AAD5Y937_9FUNG|nr:hypothetical protein HK103_003363 [Boothiomyces macroporosus]